MHDILSTCVTWAMNDTKNSHVIRAPIKYASWVSWPYLYKGFLLYLQPPDPCAPVNVKWEYIWRWFKRKKCWRHFNTIPMGWMHSSVSVHLIQGSRIFSFTSSESTNKTASIETMGKNMKFSSSVWKYSNIFGCVRLDTANRVVHPWTPLSLASRNSSARCSGVRLRIRTLFSMNRIDFEWFSASFISSGRNACIRSSLT